MAKKIFNLKYVPGNPDIFSKVYSCSSNPMARSDALNAATEMRQGWRVWVEREDTGERIYESEVEKQFKASMTDDETVTEVA